MAHEKCHPISMDLVKYLVKQIARNLQYLHTNLQMAHLDLKPDNIIIKDDLTTALIDFGDCEATNTMANTICGTA